METKDLLSNKTTPVNWQDTIKVLTIGFITMALLIPKFMIIELIGERETTADNSKKEVMQKWSLAQTVRGPVLVIPYVERNFDIHEKQMIEEIKELYLLPKTLKIAGELFPQKLYRSIYETVVYESVVRLEGNFERIDFDAVKIGEKDVMWDKAKILVSISDLRGIVEIGTLTWNGRPQHVFTVNGKSGCRTKRNITSVNRAFSR
jgi:inner membrane protein